MVKYNLNFENIRSNDEFLIKTYFLDIERIHSKRQMERYLEMVVEKMESDGVVSKGYYKIDDDKEKIFIGSKERGISFGISINTDKKTQTKFTYSNPFGKGGFAGLEFNFGLYNTLNGSAFFNDRFGNKIALSKSTQDPVILTENFKTDETSLSYSFSTKNNHSFSITASDSEASISPENNKREHKAHTGSSYKTSLLHVYKFFNANEFINPNHALYGKISSEISLPYLSSCSFLKSHFNISHIFPLYKDLFSCKFDFSFGGIFNFSSKNNKSPIIPFTDRFFNGKTFNFPGFVDSSLTDKSRTPYLGGNFFYTARTSILYKLNENANLMVYHSLGNTILTLGNKDALNSFKSNFSNLFSPKSIRSAVGFGVSVDLGMACFEGSIVKPLLRTPKDQLNSFALEVNFKF